MIMPKSAYIDNEVLPTPESANTNNQVLLTSKSVDTANQVQPAESKEDGTLLSCSTEDVALSPGLCEDIICIYLFI